MKTYPALLALILLQPVFVLAADAQAGRDCNLLGREIALRAAEELPVALDARARTQLAAIAESACLDNPLPAAVPPAGAPLATATEATDAGEQAAAPGAGEGGSLFDLEFIDPEDRVRRPGLKRR